MMFLLFLFSTVDTCQQLTYKNGMKFLRFAFSTDNISDIFDTWRLLKSKSRKKFLCPIFSAVNTSQLLKNKNRMKFFCSILTPVKCYNRRKELKSCLLVFYTLDTCQLVIAITGWLFVFKISLVKLTPVNGYQTSQ